MSGINEKMRCWVAEMIGTGFLTMSVKLAVGNGSPLAAIGIGFTLMVNVFSFGPISGAHFNPSVTTALLARGLDGFPLTDTVNVVGYYLAQMLGGLLGGTFASIIGGHAAAMAYCNSSIEDRIQPFLAEFFYTFLLTSTVIYTASDPRLNVSTMAGPNHFFGFAIGSCVVVAAITIGNISGACLNFAVYVGALVPALASRKSSEHVKDHQIWIYFLAPLLGGLCAGLVYRFLFKNDDIGKRERDLAGRLGGADTDYATERMNKL